MSTDTRYIPPLQDAQRAMRLLRAWKKREGLPDGPVGIMGFSAGGHLSAVCSNQTTDSYPKVDENDQLSAKPDFSVLIYPAYLDTNRLPQLPPEVQVTNATPPAFIVTTADDDVSNVSSLSYALACIAHKVPVELHTFPKGGHGYGLRSKEPGLKDWQNLLVAWLKQRS
jgi:acetyl esterase/lipase